MGGIYVQLVTTFCQDGKHGRTKNFLNWEHSAQCLYCPHGCWRFARARSNFSFRKRAYPETDFEGGRAIAVQVHNFYNWFVEKTLIFLLENKNFNRLGGHGQPSYTLDLGTTYQHCSSNKMGIGSSTSFAVFLLCPEGTDPFRHQKNEPFVVEDIRRPSFNHLQV